MPRCYILIGMPTSGKSTWAKKQGLPIISCDEIRKHFEFKTHHPVSEKIVWDYFYSKLEKQKESFIIDNTNCKFKYINEIKKHLSTEFEIKYIWFDISLWKAYYRNIIRWYKEDKWIPIKVLKSMYKNYNNLKNDEKCKNFW